MKLTKKQQNLVKLAKKKLDRHGHVYLALAPRSGKSLIAASLLRPEDRVLFVTKKGAIPGVRKVLAELCVEARVDVVNYESLHKVLGSVYNVFIVDEAHTLSRYPKPTAAYKKLKAIISKSGPDVKLVWLSGTPNIEARPELFHQLALSPHHPFSSYKNFYRWFDKYGIKGRMIYTGGPRPAIDYSGSVNFEEEFNDFMIRHFMKPAKISIKYVSMPEIGKELYHEVKTTGVAYFKGIPIVANGPAQRQNKLQQIGGGTVIGEGATLQLFDDIAKEAWEEYPDAAIFYKFQEEKELLGKFFPEDQLFQIDATSMGVDLSHFDKAIIYSLTWSGANFVQALARLTNIAVDNDPEVIILVKSPVDIEIIDTVLDKKDRNAKFLKGE
jgi:hypothetical protein